MPVEQRLILSDPDVVISAGSLSDFGKRKSRSSTIEGGMNSNIGGISESHGQVVDVNVYFSSIGVTTISEEYSNLESTHPDNTIWFLDESSLGKYIMMMVSGKKVSEMAAPEHTLREYYEHIKKASSFIRIGIRHWLPPVDQITYYISGMSPISSGNDMVSPQDFPVLRRQNLEPDLNSLGRNVSWWNGSQDRIKDLVLSLG